MTPSPDEVAQVAEDEPLFDAPAFARKIRVAMAQDNLSLRKLQKLIGVDQASIHRCAVKQLPPSIETYLRLGRWLANRAHLMEQKHED